MIALASIVGVLLAATRTAALWPLPQELSTGTSALKLSPAFTVDLSGVANTPSDLYDAVSRVKTQLNDDKLAILTVDRGASNANAVEKAKSLSQLRVSVPKGTKIQSISHEAVQPLGTRQEGYTLVVPADGSPATLTANSSLGLLRGLTTFTQLWYDLDGTTYTIQAPVHITDAPAYVSVVCSRWLVIMTILIIALPWTDARYG